MSDSEYPYTPLTSEDLKVLVGVMVTVSAYFYIDDNVRDDAQIMGKIASRFERDIRRLGLAADSSHETLQIAASDLVQRLRGALRE